MDVSYKKLWIRMLECDLRKADLRARVHLSASTVSKLCHNRPVSLEILGKLCQLLQCDIGDIVEFIR